MDEVEAGESLARFLTQSNQFNTLGVKPKAFMPDPYDNLSVSRVFGLEPSEIEPLGRTAVSERGCNLYGWAKLEASHFQQKGLFVRPKEPPVKHAIIERWPVEKEDRKQIAQLLAADASLHLLNAAGQQITLPHPP